MIPKSPTFKPALDNHAIDFKQVGPLSFQSSQSCLERSIAQCVKNKTQHKPKRKRTEQSL